MAAKLSIEGWRGQDTQDGTFDTCSELTTTRSPCENNMEITNPCSQFLWGLSLEGLKLGEMTHM